jgi:hypothetical protein
MTANGLPHIEFGITKRHITEKETESVILTVSFIVYIIL